MLTVSGRLRGAGPTKKKGGNIVPVGKAAAGADQQAAEMFAQAAARLDPETFKQAFTIICGKTAKGQASLQQIRGRLTQTRKELQLTPDDIFKPPAPTPDEEQALAALPDDERVALVKQGGDALIQTLTGKETRELLVEQAKALEARSA